MDRRETIEAAMNEAETGEEVATEVVAEVETPEVIEPEVTETVAPVEGEVAPVEKETRTRDASGKFSKKEAEQPAVVEGETVAEVIERLSPKAYKKELADKHWKDIPDEFKDELIRREKAVEEGFEGYKTHADLGKSVEAAIMPYMATINSLGASPDAAIKELFTVDHTLRHGGQQDKVQMMQRIFRDYNINPQDVFSAYQNQQPNIDPALRPMYDELQALKQQQQTEIQGRNDRETKTLLNEVQAFSKDKEHWATVEPEMLALLPQIKQANPAITNQDAMQKAYDSAIYANPQIRTTLLQQERDKANETALSAELARKQQAAGVSVKGSSPASVGADNGKTRRELIAQQFE